MLAVVAALRLLEELGVVVRWTEKASTPFASYSQRQNAVFLNRSLFKKGDAGNDHHVQQFAHCLFHEMGHALWSHWGRIHMSNTIDFFEEIYCDNFAASMCSKLGLEWVASQGSPYLQRFIEELESFA